MEGQAGDGGTDLHGLIDSKSPKIYFVLTDLASNSVVSIRHTLAISNDIYPFTEDIIGDSYCIQNYDPLSQRYKNEWILT